METSPAPVVPPVKSVVVLLTMDGDVLLVQGQGSPAILRDISQLRELVKTEPPAKRDAGNAWAATLSTMEKIFGV